MIKYIIILIFTLFSFNSAFAVYGDLIYTNGNDGNKLYKKNANDVSNGSAITSVYSSVNTYSPDGLYIVYSGPDNKLYKKNANDVSNGSAITLGTVNNTNISYSPDGLYIIYSNPSDGHKLYKKNANDVSNGSAITLWSAYNGGTYSPDGLYIIYMGNDGLLYRKNANDVSNGIAITSIQARKGFYSGNYIIYSALINQSMKLYKKNANDNSNGSEISSLYLTNYGLTGDNENIYYVLNNGLIYKKNINDVGNGIAINSNLSQYLSLAPTPLNVNGSCGSNAKTYLYNDTSFTGSFCSAGSLSGSLSPLFPSNGSFVSWSCNGSGTGNNVSCEAGRDNEPLETAINGSCGDNAKTYLYSENTYNGSFCSAGSLSGSLSPLFPTNTNITWSCNGSGGGNNTSCTAYKVGVIENGKCGSAEKVYGTGDTNFTGNLCDVGLVYTKTGVLFEEYILQNPLFPLPGKNISRYCLSNKPNIYDFNSSCVASRSDGTDSDFFLIGNIVNSINSIGNKLNNFFDSFLKLLNFDFNYTGFNFNINNFKNFIDLNFSSTKTKINNLNCSNMIYDKLVFLNYPYWSIQTNIYNTSGMYSILDYYNNEEYGNNSFSLYNKNYIFGEYNGNAYFQITKKTFSYIDVGNSNFIIINTNIFNNINFVPFSLTVFGVDLGEKTNNLINGTFKLGLDIIKIPFDLLNKLFGFLNILNINYEAKNSICFFGNEIKLLGNLNNGIMLNNTINSINNNNNSFIKYKTSNGSDYLYFLLLIGVSFYIYKRIRNLF